MNNAKLLAAINERYSWVQSKHYSRYLQALHLSESKMDVQLERELSALQTLVNTQIPHITINNQSQSIDVYNIPIDSVNKIEKDNIDTWVSNMANRFTAIETLIHHHFKWSINRLNFHQSKTRYFALIKALQDCLPPEVKKTLLINSLSTNKTRLLANYTAGATAIAKKISAFGQLILTIKKTSANSLYPNADSTNEILLVKLQNDYKVALSTADIHTNGVFNDYLNKRCLGHPTSYQLLRQYQPPCIQLDTSTNSSTDNTHQYQSFPFQQTFVNARWE